MWLCGVLYECDGNSVFVGRGGGFLQFVAPPSNTVGVCVCVCVWLCGVLYECDGNSVCGGLLAV